MALQRDMVEEFIIGSNSLLIKIVLEFKDYTSIESWEKREIEDGMD